MIFEKFLLGFVCATALFTGHPPDMPANGPFPVPHARTYRINGERGMGSGWAIDTRTLVTAKHVIDNNPLINVTIGDEALLVVDIYTAPEIDIAFLTIAEATPLREIMTLGMGQLTPTTPIWCGGHALGVFLGTTKGTIYHVEMYPTLYLMDVTVQPGMSGGPVVDSLDQVVAMTTAMLGEGRMFGMAIPIDTVRNAYDKFKEHKNNVDLTD